MSKINYNSVEYKVWHNAWKRYAKKEYNKLILSIAERYKKLDDNKQVLLNEYEKLTNNLLKDFKSAMKFKFIDRVVLFLLGVYVAYIITLLLWK